MVLITANLEVWVGHIVWIAERAHDKGAVQTPVYIYIVQTPVYIYIYIYSSNPCVHIYSSNPCVYTVQTPVY